MQAFFRAALVPGLILLLTGLYWLHIADAPSAAQRVPSAVIVAIVIMAVAVFVGDMAKARKAKVVEKHTFKLSSWARQWKTQLIFIALSIGYYVAFVNLGFNLANFVFLIVALPVAGVGESMSRASAALKVGIYAGLVSVVFYVLAQLMDFNAPIGPLGF